MNDLISKELLSEVLGQNYDTNTAKWEGENLRVWKQSNSTRCGFSWAHINIHELSFICKEWAYNLGYFVEIEPFFNGNRKVFNMTVYYNGKCDYSHVFVGLKYEELLEHEFKKYQWILKNS